MFTLTEAWLDHDDYKQQIRSKGSLGFFSFSREPTLLLRCQAIDIQRRPKGIPSIFD